MKERWRVQIIDVLLRRTRRSRDPIPLLNKEITPIASTGKPSKPAGAHSHSLKGTSEARYAERVVKDRAYPLATKTTKVDGKKQTIIRRYAKLTGRGRAAKGAVREAREAGAQGCVVCVAI